MSCLQKPSATQKRHKLSGTGKGCIVLNRLGKYLYTFKCLIQNQDKIHSHEILKLKSTSSRKIFLSSVDLFPFNIFDSGIMYFQALQQMYQDGKCLRRNVIFASECFF
jgi:hypothetical protein